MATLFFYILLLLGGFLGGWVVTNWTVAILLRLGKEDMVGNVCVKCITFWTTVVLYLALLVVPISVLYVIVVASTAAFVAHLITD